MSDSTTPLHIDDDAERLAQIRARVGTASDPWPGPYAYERSFRLLDSLDAALREDRDKAEAALREARTSADMQMELVKACEHIAEGDDGWEKLRNECPSTAAVASLREEAERLRAALTWAMPLAKLALEQHRQERLRCGHAVGTKMVGLYDDEVDEMREHEAALARSQPATPSPAPQETRAQFMRRECEKHQSWCAYPNCCCHAPKLQDYIGSSPAMVAPDSTPSAVTDEPKSSGASAEDVEWGRDLVRIWSGEHEAYWRPNGLGYTVRAAAAWILPRWKAEAEIALCGPEKMIDIQEASDITAARAEGERAGLERAARIAKAIKIRCVENAVALSARRFATLDDLKQADWHLAGQRHAASEAERDIRALLPPTPEK